MEIPGISIIRKDKHGKEAQRYVQRRGPQGVEALTPDGTWEKLPPPGVAKKFEEALAKGDLAAAEAILEKEGNYWLEERALAVPGLAEKARAIRKKRRPPQGTG